MTGTQRIAAALRGEWPDRRPVMLHNFMMAARESGITMAEFRSSPEALARAFAESVEKYGLDGILVDVDTATLAEACGVPVSCPEDEPAIAHGRRLAHLEEIDCLEPVDISRCERVQVWLEGVTLLVKRFGGQVWVRGNCDQAPFSLAAMIRGMDDFFMDLMDPAAEPRVMRLLEYAFNAGAQFLKLMAATAADMISNGDSTGGSSLISPLLHRKFAHPFEERMAEVAHSLGLPWALHVCGNTNPILADLAATGADALELDYKTDPRKTREALDGRAALIGNIDPTGVLAQGTPEMVERAVQELDAAFRETPRLIINSGCALPADTPPENIRALVRAARLNWS